MFVAGSRLWPSSVVLPVAPVSPAVDPKTMGICFSDLFKFRREPPMVTVNFHSRLDEPD